MLIVLLLMLFGLCIFQFVFSMIFHSPSFFHINERSSISIIYGKVDTWSTIVQCSRWTQGCMKLFQGFTSTNRCMRVHHKNVKKIILFAQVSINWSVNLRISNRFYSSRNVECKDQVNFVWIAIQKNGECLLSYANKWMPRSKICSCMQMYDGYPETKLLVISFYLGKNWEHF